MTSPLIDRLQVNIPFSMLSNGHLDRFIDNQLNPEIGFDAATLDTSPFSRMETVAGRLLEAGLSITFHAPFMDLSPGSPDPKIREVTRLRFRQIARLIPLFKPRTVVCHTGYDHKRYWYIRDVWLENSLEVWPEIAGDIQAGGAAMMLENVYERSPDDLIGLLENLKGYGVGFCLDTGHQAVFGRVPVDAWIDSLGPFLRQLHLHDNFGKEDEHLALGRGRIDFRHLFTLLRAVLPARPVITLEPHKEEELWPSLAYLEKIWPW